MSSSPALPNALDSLDKLLRFSASISVETQSGRGRVEPENLASIAESFLKTQNALAASKPAPQSEAPAPELEPGEVLASPVPTAVPTTPALSPNSRAAELKQLLLKNKRKVGQLHVEVKEVAEPATHNRATQQPPQADVSLESRISPKKHRREQDQEPPARNGSYARRSSSPHNPNMHPTRMSREDDRSRRSEKRPLNYQLSATNFVPERMRKRSSTLTESEPTRSYTHRSSRSPMRYDSVGGSTLDDRSKYAPKASLPGRGSDVTMKDVRGSTASLLR